MRVLVTGASGFVGGHVVERLLAAGHVVRGLVRATSNVQSLKALGVELVDGAIDRPDSLPAALRGCDAVVHLAGLVAARDPADFVRINGSGTGDLVRAAVRVTPDLRRFVYVSSIAALGPALPGHARCDHREPRPVSAYGRSKRRGEVEALATGRGLPLTIVRPPAVYGPRDYNLVALFRALRFGVAPALGGADSRFSMIFVTDLAEALRLAIETPHPAPACYTVDDGGAYAWRDVAAAAARVVGRPAPYVIPLPRALASGAAMLLESVARLRGRSELLSRDKVNEIYQRSWVCGHDDIRRELGYEPQVPLEAGLRLTYDAYRSAGIL